MTTAKYNATNPFAVRIDRPGKKPAYVPVHQPKSFDWQARQAKPHPMKKALTMFRARLRGIESNY